MNTTPHRNRLARETSPYLLQHAGNPVEWYPWCEEALEKARREDKPILLSIGYSACHWCHVMAHESFEDQETAEVMNALFVNIKVDREERPDLDKIYQLSHQLLTRRPGGWPLTVFLDPHDQAPFFSGTYFPKESRYNLPGFVWLLRQVSGYYRENKESLRKNSQALTQALRSISAQRSEEGALDAIPPLARRDLERDFDSENGGFGSAPKFPHPAALAFLLRQWYRSDGTDGAAHHMMDLTLKRMAEGGIYDQLGGGFCRYSVDADWHIPHFEKMLYDNGPLLALYSETWQATQSPLFRRVAVETAEWVMREMQSPNGGYYSSLDADSEGEEGKFYVWDRRSVQALLTPDEYALIQLHYGLDQTPNFEGHWHFHVAVSLEEAASRLGIDPEGAKTHLQTARAKLLAARERRVRPGRDEKILTAWNALMIKGMAIAGRILGRDDFLVSAERAFDFLHRSLWRDGRLLAAYKDGQARFPAYLDDYAFLMDAGLELLQSRWSKSALIWTQTLADDLLARFEDRESGGFYFTAHDHEALIHRPKSVMDEAMPSGNGVAARALAGLGHLLGDDRYLTGAERTLKAAMSAMQGYPSAHGAFLIALDEWLNPPQIVVLRGEAGSMEPWRNAAQTSYAPGRLCIAIPEDETELPGLLAERKPADGVVAYVCEAARCLPPVHSLEEFESILSGTGVGRRVTRAG
jgi:uncharacterized protein YyaL (SSP411 family)